MSPPGPDKDLAALLKKLRALYPATSPPPAPGPCGLDAAEPVLGEFLRAFLHWEAPASKAAGAVRRIEAAVVDFNELRICLPDELMRIMGDRYPKAEERALRLRAALADVYARQHAVTLEHLPARGKREAKEYLESLDGVPRYVAARVGLLCLAVHEAPADTRITRRLVEGGIVEAGATPDEASAALERRLRAGELAEAYTLLQAWADDLSESADAVAPGAGGFKPRPKPVAPPEDQADRKRPTAPKKTTNGKPAPRRRAGAGEP